MRKCLPLNLFEPTITKRRMLRETYNSFLSIVKDALSCVDGVTSRGQLHNKTYEALRSRYGVASQLVIEATSYAWSIRKRRRKTAGSSEVDRCVVRFDRRLLGFGKTKRGNPVLVLRTNTKRIALPASRDGAYRRLQEHLAQGWELTSVIMKRSMSILVAISKRTPDPIVRRNWLGVDINSSRIAISIISPAVDILRQTYCGETVSTRQFGFEKRRASLQRYRDTASRGNAGLKLRRLSKRQKDYVRTSMWTLANEIVRLAEAFNASIAIEKLRHLRKRRGEWSASSRRKVNRIPYGFLRRTLKHVAERRCVLVVEVNPSYTSQMCPHCGHTSKANWRGYTYFRCSACGFEMNRDRVASVNIALRAAHPAYIHGASSAGQSIFPEGSASVSRRVWQGEGFEAAAPNNPELQAHKL